MLAVNMKKKRRNVAMGQIAQYGQIQYASEMDQDLFMGLAVGTPVEMKARPKRNIMHHRKYFALMKIGLEYWQPDIKFISKAEYWIAHQVAKYFAELSQNKDFYEQYAKEVAERVLQGVTKERSMKLNSDVFHNIDLYRRKIMIDAGFFDYILLPDGGALREPYSIAFDEMSQEKFNEIYQGCFNQIWQQTLIQVFKTEYEAQKAIDEMLSFV